VKLTIVRKTLPELARELGKPVDEPVPVQPATTLAEPTDEEKRALARVEPVSARVSRNAYQRARESRQTTSERPFDP
jgi:hypothetical protein